MQRSVSQIFQRWLGPPKPEVTGTCERRLGTGADPSVARALRDLDRDVPRDYGEYERNMRDLTRIAEGDLVIAAVRASGHSGELVRERDVVRVDVEEADGRRVGDVEIRYQTADLDPKGVGEPHTWVLGARVPADLVARIAQLAPTWVIVKQREVGGREVVVRGAQRRSPPRQWGRRLPMLPRPPIQEGFGK